MSDMNLSMSGLAGLLPGLPLEAGMGTVPAQMPKQGEGFADLLGLVEDMETADSQIGNVDVNSVVSRETAFPALNEIEVAKRESDLAMAVSPALASLNAPAPMVQELSTAPKDIDVIGREANPLRGMKETPAWPVEIESLNLQAQRDFAHKAANPKLDGEAVAQWSAALASGDVKSVVLESTPGIAIEERGPARGFVKPTIRPEAGARVDTKVEPKAALPLAVTSSDMLAASAAPVAEKSEAIAAKPEVATEAPTKPESTVRKAEASAPRSESGSVERKESVSELSSEPLARPKVRDASSFLLERSDLTADAGVRADLVANAKIPALAGAAYLGESRGDERVSPESVKFVADRIDQLKAQGGGTIKIELNPQQMGTIEVRVSMSRSQVRVQVSAERPETLKALEASRADLTSRLNEGTRAADLEIVAKAGAVRRDSMSVGQTDSFLDIRDVSANRRASDVQDVSMSGSAMTSDRRDSGSSDFGRDERREEARDRWESLFRQRKSA